LVKRFPKLDDSGTRFETDADGFPTRVYGLSLAHFDDIVNQIERDGPKVYPQQVDLYDSHSDVTPLVHILRNKFDQAQQDEALRLILDLDHIAEQYSYLHRGFVNYCRVLPIASLLHLRHVVSMINPLPQHFESRRDLLHTVIENIVSLEGRSQSEIQSMIYQGRENPELIEWLKAHLRRAYEGLRAAIGSRVMHYEILQRYKARCMWYDRERLGSLLKHSVGEEEDALTRDLALYLFDNGISTLYRVRRGAHEYDLVGHRTETPILVEAKVYKDSKHARHNLVQGVAQLHSYLNGLEAEDPPIQEVYYVVYRLGGPLYDIPWEISTNRRTFYPMLVDLGPSQVSGRRQPKPISIELKDFFAVIV
jgi:hypothetical protein